MAAAGDVPAGDAAVDTRLDALFGEHDSYRVFLRDLQQAVAAHAREQVAGMVSYPLTTRVRGNVLHLHSPQQFLTHYEELLPPSTRNAIVSQSYGQLFANSQGVMIGAGEVWFSGICKERACAVKISAFNPAP